LAPIRPVSGRCRADPQISRKRETASLAAPKHLRQAEHTKGGVRLGLLPRVLLAELSSK
jgi:hypothetical protein